MLKIPPSIAVTEDTPPDMLSGSMDLCFVLPTNKTVRLNVERSTPMLDLLVQVTTAHKMSPGSHYLQPFEENCLPLPYKPSTPIGTLDAVTIHVLPKTGGSIQAMVSRRHNVKPFEKTFRVQVHLPHNQLFVMRTNGNTKLEDLLHQICKTKNLDASKYCLRHSDKTDKALCLSKTIADHNLQQLYLVPNSAVSLGVSKVDLIDFKLSLVRCDESVSSGSIGGRSLSPTRSDDSTESPPLASVMPPPRPGRKRRPAPKPPQLQSQKSVSSSNSDLSHYLISHSRNSSDSSGYHEAPLLSESPGSNSLPDSLPRRSKLISHQPSNINLPHKFKMSQSCSNLNFASTGSTLCKNSIISSSSVSLSSAAGKKNPAPLPPTAHSKMSSLPEEKSKTLQSSKVTNSAIEKDLKQKVATLPSSFPSLSVISSHVESQPPPTPECRSSFPFSKIPQPKPRIKLLNGDRDTVCNVKRRAPSPPKRMKCDSINDSKEVDSTESNRSLEQPKDSSLACDTGNTIQENFNAEFKLDDEIDRIFHNATKDYDTQSLTYTKLNDEPESLQWQYKLPDPPTAFRDMNNATPSLTEFDTVTICNLTEIVSRDPNDNILVINSEITNDIYDKNEELPKPEEIANANETIVNVVHDNDYKKYKPNDDGSDSKLNSMGNDSGLELDDISSKLYENNNQNSEQVNFEIRNGCNEVSETLAIRRGASNIGLKLVPMIEKWCSNDSQQGIDKRTRRCLQEDTKRKQEIKKINDYHCFETGKNLLCNETIHVKTCEKVISEKPINKTNETGNVRNNPIVSCDRERELHSKDEDTKKTRMTATKSAVVNELSSFINESKVGVREFATVLNENILRTAKPEPTGKSTSSLANFKISTYESMKRPISIYCDDSVVNTVTMKPKEEKPKTTNTKIYRHNSMSQYDRPDMSSAMKRSSSYISLLSNPMKFNLHKFDKFFSSSCENLKANTTLKSFSGEARIGNENSIVDLNDNRKEVPWKRKVQNMSELQSIQVLKNILPRLSVPEEASMENEDIVEQIQSASKVKAETISEEDPEQNKNIPRRYSDQGVPDFNFTTWNERAKVQVNLKTDKDYKTGRKFQNDVNSVQSTVTCNNFMNVTNTVNGVQILGPVINDVENCKKNSAEIENQSVPMKLDSWINSYKKPVSIDKSPHAPIVRAVELKKPLSYINTTPKVARPISCYLFGENVGDYKMSSNVSTRDMFLESIRSFGKNNLKKVTSNSINSNENNIA